MKIAVMRARFTGLYEWGVGWVSNEKAEAWDRYFNSIGKSRKTSHWRLFRDNEHWSNAAYLVSVGGSVYLHPMDITAVTHTDLINRKYDGEDFVNEYPDMDELKSILKEAASACGGTVSFSDIKEINYSLE